MHSGRMCLVSINKEPYFSFNQMSGTQTILGIYFPKIESQAPRHVYSNIKPNGSQINTKRKGYIYTMNSEDWEEKGQYGLHSVFMERHSLSQSILDFVLN